MNTPNKLTILRIILVPIMVIISYLPISGSLGSVSFLNLILLAIFIIASLTDQLDRYLARKNNQVTNFGKFLDPIADKILVITSLIILVTMNVLPYWIVVLIVFREFIISGYRLIVVEQNGKVIAASWQGKVKTATTMLAIIFGFLTNNSYFAFINQGLSGWNLFANIIYSILMTIAIITTITSALDYMKGYKEILK